MAFENFVLLAVQHSPTYLHGMLGLWEHSAMYHCLNKVLQDEL